MLCNATVNSWRRVTATSGSGEPVFEDVTMPHKIPAELVMPSAARRATERASGIELVRVLRVARSALVATGRTPEVGDRIVFATQRNPDVQEEHDIVERIEHPDEAGEVYELKLGARVDSRTGEEE